MATAVSRPQLIKIVQTILGQSEFLPSELASQADDLSTEELEKLTITLHWALETEQQLSQQQKSKLADHLVEYFNGKRRIFQRAQKAWVAQQEAVHEAQESLFEEALLQKL